MAKKKSSQEKQEAIRPLSNRDGTESERDRLFGDGPTDEVIGEEDKQVTDVIEWVQTHYAVDEERVESFSQAWAAARKSGQRPTLEDYLSGLDGAARENTLLHLLQVETIERTNLGEQLTVEEYLSRFPPEARYIKRFFSDSYPAYLRIRARERQDEQGLTTPGQDVLESAVPKQESEIQKEPPLKTYEDELRKVSMPEAPAATDLTEEPAPRRRGRQRPPLVRADMDQHIARVEGNVAKRQLASVQEVQMLLNAVAGRSADDYETNKRHYDHIMQCVKDSALVLLCKGQPVTVSLAKPPPQTKSGYFEVRNITGTARLDHGNAWPVLTVLTPAEWQKQQKEASKTEKVAAP